jgi:hypothetical protein
MQSKVRYAANTYKLTTVARLTLHLNTYCFGSSSTDIYVYAVAYLYNAINSLSFSLCSDCWHCGVYVGQLALPFCQCLHITMSPVCMLFTSTCVQAAAEAVVAVASSQIIASQESNESDIVCYQ